jgi:hypothetical protein
MDLPQNIGVGVANRSLMDGRLLVGVDVLYKLWDETDLYGVVYNNQWVVQVGGQYSVGRWRLRGGYAWAQNPIDPNPVNLNIGGVPLPNLPAVATRRAWWRSPASTGCPAASVSWMCCRASTWTSWPVGCSPTPSNSAISPRRRSRATGWRSV